MTVSNLEIRSRNAGRLRVDARKYHATAGTKDERKEIVEALRPII